MERSARPPTLAVMHLPARLRESAAILILGALVVTVASAAIVTAVLVGGVPGLLAGVVAAVATVQFLRRPVGRLLAVLVET
jgi:hypothetical protein